jgi:hypothetical protein
MSRKEESPSKTYNIRSLGCHISPAHPLKWGLHEQKAILSIPRRILPCVNLLHHFIGFCVIQLVLHPTLVGELCMIAPLKGLVQGRRLPPSSFHGGPSTPQESTKVFLLSKEDEENFLVYNGSKIDLYSPSGASHSKDLVEPRAFSESKHRPRFGSTPVPASSRCPSLGLHTLCWAAQ